jgi:hypothetical protein
VNDAGAGRGERFAEKILAGPMRGVLGIMRRNLGAAVGLKLLSMVCGTQAAVGCLAMRAFID